jgi:hypothetical protein
MRYPSLEAFYAGDHRRRSSRERDVGLFWRGRGGATYRAAWVQATGELYVLEHGRPHCRGGHLRVVGRYGARELEETFAGWRDACGRPRSLDWLLERADGARVEPPRGGVKDQTSSASWPAGATGARRGSGSTSSKPARRTPRSLTGLAGA